MGKAEEARGLVTRGMRRCSGALRRFIPFRNVATKLLNQDFRSWGVGCPHCLRLNSQILDASGFWLSLREYAVPMYHMNGNLALATSLAFLCSIDAVTVSAQVPDGVSEVRVNDPDEVSGVAVVPEGYLVVGDGEPRYFYEVTKNAKTEISFGNTKGNICDPESIDAGFTPSGERKLFVLGEDAKTVFVQGGRSIPLPAEFFERCNRGAEGLSVRWRDNGWDLVVISEGGIPQKKHVPNEDKTENCKKIERVSCPIENAIYNPVMARYRLSSDGKSARLVNLVTLHTADLLKDQDPSQGFRASDITWYQNNLLVLLGSTPVSRRKKDGYKHTWLKLFTPNGVPIANKTMKLEDQWGEYRDDKNWEALDVKKDGERLVMGYDDKKKPSALVVFSPDLSDE